MTTVRGNGCSAHLEMKTVKVMVMVKMKKSMMETSWWMVIVSVGHRQAVITTYHLHILMKGAAWTGLRPLTCEAHGVVVLEAADGNVRRTNATGPLQACSRYRSQLFL